MSRNNYFASTVAAVKAGNGNREWPQIVKLMNGVLIEWKAEILPEFLQKSSPIQLTYLSVKLEESLLKYDWLIKETNDLVADVARQVPAPGQAAPAKKAFEDALKMAHIWEERKAIMIDILASVMQAAPQRAAMVG